jgi:plastocyanin
MSELRTKWKRNKLLNRRLIFLGLVLISVILPTYIWKIWNPIIPNNSTYRLIIEIDGSGTTVPSKGYYTFHQGEKVPISEIPSSHWKFNTWILDNITIGNNMSIQVSMTKDHVLKAVFSEIPLPANTKIIKIRDDSFEPQTISIFQGTKLTWINFGLENQTSTNTNKIWDSSIIRPTANFTLTFNEVGIFHYFSIFHAESMKGTIIVKANVLNYTVALDGTGDYENIQSAIDAVPAKKTAVIHVKAGEYLLNPFLEGPVNSIVVASEIAIIGSGIDKTIIKCFPNTLPAGSKVRAPAFLCTLNLNNFTLKNMTIIQNGTPDNQGWNAIDFRGGSNNIKLSNLKVTDTFGACASITDFNNVTIENCQFLRGWTGISLSGGRNAQITNNKIIEMKGDGVFPQTHGSIPVNNVIISGNYIENAGDTGIDITSSGGDYHSNITVIKNTLVNSHIRVSGAENITLENNNLRDGDSYISVDSGQGQPVNVLVENNIINTKSKSGIIFSGGQNCRAIGNKIFMFTPQKGISQTGISAGIFGIGKIMNNYIVNSSSYGIDFANYELNSGSEIAIVNNTIVNFGIIGIWDNNLNQESVIIEYNVIWDRNNPFISKYGIKTSEKANPWVIKFNHIYAGSISPISAPSSQISNNIFTPMS